MENTNKIAQYELLCDSAIDLAKIDIISQFLKNMAIEIISLKNQDQEMPADDIKKFDCKYEEFKKIIDSIIGKVE